MDISSIQRFAPVAVTTLVFFLAFSSQWLFRHIEPGALEKGDAYIFNILVASLLICYWRTCLKDPGRIPKDWQELINAPSSSPSGPDESKISSNRWCRKCEAFKPPRAHHCKTCQRCIMKMDHHCVWTANCVSHITIPHFIRFLFYAVVSMVYLEYFLFLRVSILWEKRHLPSYLGPSVLQLAHLFVLVGTNSLVLFALSILLGRTVWSLAINTWTIESWEIERHHTLLRRARTLGGHLEGPDGEPVRIEHQEFPWDVGIWSNICQGMGTWNPLAWFWPFAQSPGLVSGLQFEHNEIDDPSKPWPPPDPDRNYRATVFRPTADVGDAFTQPWDVDEFRRRQARDRSRYTDADGDYVVRRRPFHERLERMMPREANDADYGNAYPDGEDGGEEMESDGVDPGDDEEEQSRKRNADVGEEGWRNREGERLADFGVDEVADFYDEDEVPLSELIRRRKQAE